MSNVIDSNAVYVANEEAVTRNSFISKVYGLLTKTLLTSMAAAYIGTQLNLGFAALIILVIAEFAVLMFAIKARKNKSCNIQLLYGFAALSGLTLSPMLSMYILNGQSNLIVMAFTLTSVLFGSLTYYVHTSKKDFSYLGGFLFSGLILLLVAGLLGFFFPAIISSIAYSVIGVLLFSGFVLYDTSNILHHYASDEYIVATLNLHLDFLNLFIDLLRLVTNLSKD